MSNKPKQYGRDDLVAYLDGELEAEVARTIEEKLSSDPNLQKNLQQLEASWDLLDDLPKSDVAENFTQSTIGMVALRATEDIQEASIRAGSRRWYRWLGAIAVFSIVGSIGFYGHLYWLDRDNRQLLQDLEVIERVDIYKNIDDIDFLLTLSDEDLFAEDEDEYEQE